MNSIRPASQVVGEIVRINLFNAIEDPFARGKGRPALLVAPAGGQWWALGLTSKPTYKTGASAGRPRHAITNPQRYGLSGPSFIYSDRLARISRIDIGDHFGFADSDLVEDVIAFTGIYGAWASGLRAAVRLGGAA